MILIFINFFNNKKSMQKIKKNSIVEKRRVLFPKRKLKYKLNYFRLKNIK